MKRIIHPPLAEHEALRQKMTPGERSVLNFFHRYLPFEWEMYIQPHLNGLRPDFVLLNPKVGVAVFEVKDWNLDAMRYFTKDGRLWAEKDGEEFCIQKDNPLTKVNLYKQEIYDLYCPRIGTHVKNHKHQGWAAITAGVIFPFADTSRVRALLASFLPQSNDAVAQYQPISGRNEINNGKILDVFPESKRKASRFMTEIFAEDLRGWLVEPDFSVTQRQPLDLDKNQRTLAATRTPSGYRRIKGPAGSGKSQVLAARAARLMNENKSVLIVTFNITLWHYLRDLIVRDLDIPSRKDNVEFTHFHLWCKHICYDVGWDTHYKNLFEKTSDINVVLNELLPALADKSISTFETKKYDAILVDEGQDLQPLWWNTLRKACKPGGEMLLAADATQDVYSVAKAWTDDTMAKAGFSGPWSQLNVSYRLPNVALDQARKFALKFLPKETLELPEHDQYTLEVYPCNLRWVQCSANAAETVCVNELVALIKLTGKNELANVDITFLADTNQFGNEVVNELAKYNLHTIDTFAESAAEQRRKKMGFYMGDARIKATTIHSFKGWENRLLVVYISKASDLKTLALIYAGLTRLKRSVSGSWLTVVCSTKELEAFGKTWPTYTEV
jgi:hypothetical protein